MKLVFRAKRRKQMNIDKFGHHVHKRLRGGEISDLKYKALIQTGTGLCFEGSLQLKGVAKPVSPDDAVNKQYVDECILNMYTKQHIDSMLNTINNQIHHLASQLKLNFYLKKEIDDIINKLNNDKRTNSERNPSISSKKF